MPSPFNNKSEAQPQAGVEKVTNSTLACDVCYEVTDHGDYYESKELLVFVCPNGHTNEVKISL